MWNVQGVVVGILPALQLNAQTALATLPAAMAGEWSLAKRGAGKNCDEIYVSGGMGTSQWSCKQWNLRLYSLFWETIHIFYYILQVGCPLFFERLSQIKVKVTKLHKGSSVWLSKSFSRQIEMRFQSTMILPFDSTLETSKDKSFYQRQNFRNLSCLSKYPILQETHY